MSSHTSANTRTKNGAGRDRGAQLMRSGTIAVIAVALSAMAACDSLLEVEVPGAVTEEALNDSKLAQELVFSAQSAFDCMLSTYVEEVGRWAGDFYYAANGSGFIYTQLRTNEVLDFEQVDCKQEGPTRSAAVWLPLQIARVQGEQAITLLQGFPNEDVDHKNFLLAKAHAYTGYAYQIMGETFCELAFDGGPKVTREGSMKLAEGYFTDAIQLAGSATSAPSGEVVGDILNMALVGRARTRLHLANTAGVVADASQVGAGFVGYAHQDEITGRRSNRIFENVNRGLSVSVHPSYQNLTVGGVPDPRVPHESKGLVGFDAVTDINIQLKYPSLGSDIPFSTWREAQLMLAEVQGGQTAVGIINTLRSTVEDLPFVAAGGTALPAFSSSDTDEILAQVLEERRRELWMQGTKLGDVLRMQARSPVPAGYAFETGLNQRGQAYGSGTCYPMPLAEKDNNLNF